MTEQSDNAFPMRKLRITRDVAQEVTHEGSFRVVPFARPELSTRIVIRQALQILKTRVKSVSAVQVFGWFERGAFQDVFENLQGLLSNYNFANAVIGTWSFVVQLTLYPGRESG